MHLRQMLFLVAVTVPWDFNGVMAAEVGETPLPPAEPRVFRLAANPDLESMLDGLLGPTDLVIADNSLFVVVVVIPLGHGESLLRARVSLWDGYLLRRRRRAVRWLLNLSSAHRDRLPWNPFGDRDLSGAKRGYCLRRSGSLGRNGSWVGNINGHGVVMFPIAGNSVTAAEFDLVTERFVGPGRRVRNRKSTVALPIPADGGEGQALKSLEALYDVLGWERRP